MESKCITENEIKNDNRSCNTCKFASNPYKLTKPGYYPPTSIYIQCNVPISDELRALLPTSFYRESATKVGVVHPENGNDQMFDVGNDCPCWLSKHDASLTSLCYDKPSRSLLTDVPEITAQQYAAIAKSFKQS